MELVLCTNNSSTYTIVADSSKTSQFAAGQLQHYLQRSCDIVLPIIATPASPAIILTQTGSDAEGDQYSVEVKDNDIHITGSNARSVLYGVYAFLESAVGIRFYSPEFEYIPAHKMLTISPSLRIEQTADFRIRTIRAEWTMNIKLVDWAAKNRFNSFSLDLWRLDGSTEWVDAAGILAAVEERGLMIEGSGHAMCYFLKADTYFDAHPEWFPEVEGLRVRGMYTGDNFCYSNPVAVEQCATNVIAFLRTIPAMKRLSIWMGDGGKVCSCSECRKRPFMENYGQAVRRIKQRVGEEIGDAVIFQEAYNFSYQGVPRTVENKTRTLRVPPEYHDLPTLFAFWGQDLSIPLAENTEQGHRLFYSYVQEFCKHNPKDAYIFSMHTDTFMLSNLCPVFGDAMVKDFYEFKQLGIDQMFLLWITWNTESEQNMEWVGYQNGALWSRVAEDIRFDIHEYRRDYYRLAFGQEQADQAEALWNRLNDILNKLQPLVFPFAPFRSTDAWGCGFSRMHEPLRWKLDTSFGPWAQKRIDRFTEAEKNLEQLNDSANTLFDMNKPECEQFKKYVEHCFIRAKGLTRLFHAQEAMQAGRWLEAKTFLTQALDSGMTDEREDTQRWLAFVESKM